MDFNKLRAKKVRSVVTDPVEIFRRLPKPEGINDLYTSQAEVLNAWFANRQAKDTILKLHTGGGKTLVGLLIGQSSLNETGEPVLYLVPTVQLVRQTIEKAMALGIPTVPYVRGEPLNADFVNGKAIMVATYRALFNGKSKFGLRGSPSPQNVSTIILDDAHAAFSVVRESFTIEVSRDNDIYNELSSQFRQVFGEVGKLGTFDDIVSNKEYAILEIPYWAWHQKLDVVREILKNDSFGLEWALLRDQLHLCHALISRRSFTITPIQPLVNLFPTFFDAPHRIYMSATIADDSDIVRTFDVDPAVVNTTLSSRSLAGISERMILIPDLMPCKPNLNNVLKALFNQTASANLGAVVLTSSDQKAQQWGKIATPVTGTTDVERKVIALQEKKELGPFVFSNRYDGMDLPGDSCRLLVLSGLPSGTSNYELFKASALYGGKTITKMMAQRIEQGIGRGSRGAGDYCVVILTGTDLSGWISKKANFAFLTSATRAQLEIGEEISKEVTDIEGIINIVQQCYNRDKDWIEYHAESLAELTDSDSQNKDLEEAGVERKAINLWQDGHYEKAIKTIDKYLEKNNSIDNQTRGWLVQLSARIADSWGNSSLAEDKQQRAYALNRNLIRPRVRPPYLPQPRHQSQSEEIVRQINEFRDHRGFLKAFEENVSYLNPNSSANQFEQSLCELAKMIGIYAERHDDNGEGPDVLWLLPDKVGFVIEAKSRKKEQNALTKEEHGQLLVADEWFTRNYPDYRSVRISVHPTNQATKVAEAGGSYALTFKALESLISDARAVLTKLCESKLDTEDIIAECDVLLEKTNIRHDRILDAYLRPFEETE
jgi:replicative superfamily II helicase